ncbi:hypothetical protein AALP_AA5G228600 [Arabis alpina]|uniref:MATH domain-containing protein n=1 Tax=Arabis alpina TaxID=50452 RepID=A0A087GYV2_ARAAL|nr:hypothetical protein AALP_AA5G228600 [Arabis alpina]
MAKQVDNKFIWVIKNFSSLQDEEYYSVPVLIGDSKWRLVAYLEEQNGYFSLFLEAIDGKLLSSGWKQYTEFRLTIVNQISEVYSRKIVIGRSWFDAKNPMWGFRDVIPLSSLNDKNSGFLVNGELMIAAEVDAFATIGTLYPCDDSEWTAIDYSSSEENEDDKYVDFNGFEILRSQVEQAKEIFEKHPDITSNLDLKNAWVKNAYVDVLISLTETLSKSPKGLTEEDLNFAASAFSDLTKAGFKLDWLSPKLDQALEEQRACGALEILEVISTLDTTQAEVISDDHRAHGYSSSSEDLQNKVDETIEVNGFQVNQVKAIFKKHPDLTSNFDIKNQEIKNAYMYALLDLIKPLCKTPKELIKEDLNKADNTLSDLIKSGFNLDWLRQKMDQALEKQIAYDTRIRELEKQVKKRKLALTELEADLEKEKAAASAAMMSIDLDEATQHWFDSRASDWGFTSMFPLIRLHDKDGGFLVNDEVNIVAETEEDDGAGSCNSLKEASSVKEIMEVNGFKVLPSQVESVSCIFERHPDFASEFHPKNQHLRSAYMNVLLGVIEMLCQSTEELSKDDLTDAEASLEYLTNAGFDLDWLEEKLEEVTEKKEEEAGETRLQEIEKELKDLKLKCSNLEAELEKEKVDVSVARAPLSFDDVV